MEGAAKWSATGLENQGIASTVGVRFLHLPLSSPFAYTELLRAKMLAILMELKKAIGLAVQPVKAQERFTQE
jgi:hypothetical protein